MMRRLMVICAALALALSACEMGADLKVNPDGSGTFGFSFAIEDTLAGPIPGGADPFAGFREELANDPVPWTFEEFNERAMQGIRATFPFSSVEDLKAKMAALDEAEGGSGPGGFGENFKLEKTASGWVLEGTGEGPGAGLSGGLGAPPSDAPPGFEQSFDPAALASLITVSMRVTLPGTSVSSNATETIPAGGSTTFVWKLDASSTAPVSLSAQTKVAAAAVPLVPIGAGVLLVGAGLIAAARLRRPKSDPPEPVLEGFTPRARDDDEELAV